MLSECVCQDCGAVLEEGTGVKISSEGWVCDQCAEELVKGNDYY